MLSKQSKTAVRDVRCVDEEEEEEEEEEEAEAEAEEEDQSITNSARLLRNLRSTMLASGHPNTNY